MTDKMFLKLWQDALAQKNRELYIAEYGYPDWFGEISRDAAEVVSVLEVIHDAAHMTIRELIEKAGMTQAAFACHFCIPLRTVEDWATGKRKCADYIRLMMAKELGLLNIAAG